MSRWRNGCWRCTTPSIRSKNTSTEAQEWLGLAAEFRKHVKWLPGGRLKRGHLDFDHVFDHLTGTESAGLERQENRRARAIILNFVRDYGDLEYINVGWINESLSRSSRPERGRRDVYVVAMKRASEDHDQVHMLRMQKWDMTFRLDQGKSPETAMFETEEYTEYTQDRYLGCRRLGMNLFGPVRIGKISELYHGTQKERDGTPIWTPYFERDYVHGIASDKVTKDHWSRPGYAERFAQLLGQAAASNIIVGRGDGKAEGIADEDLMVFFDDGDEIIVERDGMVDEPGGHAPYRIVLAFRSTAVQVRRRVRPSRDAAPGGIARPRCFCPDLPGRHDRPVHEPSTRIPRGPARLRTSVPYAARPPRRQLCPSLAVRLEAAGGDGSRRAQGGHRGVSEASRHVAGTPHAVVEDGTIAATEKRMRPYNRTRRFWSRREGHPLLTDSRRLELSA